MRGVPQASVSRLTAPSWGLRWFSWITVRPRLRRRTLAERIETLERLERLESRGTGRQRQLPDLSRQWQRRF